MALVIPKRQIEAIGKLLKYNNANLNLLVEIVRDSPPALTAKNLADKFADTTRVPKREAVDVVQTIVATYATRIGRQFSIEKFLEEFCESIQASELKPTKEEMVNFRKFLTEILNLKGNIEITSKAWDILLGNERNFIEAKIFTDLRPVFRENPAEPPAGAVIVHTLKIEYSKDNDRKEVFISLDSSDLQKLKKVVERAGIKEASLLSLVSQTKLPVVCPEE